MRIAQALFHSVIFIFIITLPVLLFGVLCYKLAKKYEESTNDKKEQETHKENISRFENAEVVCYHGDKIGVWCHWKLQQ